MLYCICESVSLEWLQSWGIVGSEYKLVLSHRKVNVSYMWLRET